MPVCPAASASTTTIVVWSHSKVPSDSGASVGTVNTDTRRRSILALSPFGIDQSGGSIAARIHRNVNQMSGVRWQLSERSAWGKASAELALHGERKSTSSEMLFAIGYWAIG